MDVNGERANRPYDETLDAAKMLEEIAQFSGKQPASSEKEPHRSETEAGGEGELSEDKSSGAGAASAPPSRTEGEGAANGSSDSDPTSAGGKEEPGEPSIGELFFKLVKLSPEDKVRIEEGSIGALFKKYLQK